MTSDTKELKNGNGKTGWITALAGIPVAALATWCVTVGEYKQRVERIETNDRVQAEVISTLQQRNARMEALLESMSTDIRDIKSMLRK